MGQGKTTSRRATSPADSRPTVHWAQAPEAHDYPAAAAYLSLLADPATVTATIPARLGPLGTPA